jgi:hypothetical protein
MWQSSRFKSGKFGAHSPTVSGSSDALRGWLSESKTACFQHSKWKIFQCVMNDLK